MKKKSYGIGTNHKKEKKNWGEEEIKLFYISFFFCDHKKEGLQEIILLDGE